MYIVLGQSEHNYISINKDGYLVIINNQTHHQIDMDSLNINSMPDDVKNKLSDIITSDANINLKLSEN